MAEVETAYKRFAVPVLMLSPPGPLADRESMTLVLK